MQPAKYGYLLADGRVECKLCPHHCKISEGQRGICRVRTNQSGQLYSLNYGRVAACAVDPIEKKPLFHFYPGKKILSFGSVGCNLGCSFCQNWTIAHSDPETSELTPTKAVELAASAGPDNLGIAYTYSEPLMWYEFVLDTAPLVHDQGLKNVLVTNGYIEAEPLRELLPHLDAMNIDVKGFQEDYYGKICRGKLGPVLKTVELAAECCHVEVTTLLVTDLNDSPGEIKKLARWLASISPEIPLHLSRYFPNYKLDKPPTPKEKLLEAYQIAKEKLEYVYLGNV